MSVGTNPVLVVSLCTVDIVVRVVFRNYYSSHLDGARDVEFVWREASDNLQRKGQYIS